MPQRSYSSTLRTLVVGCLATLVFIGLSEATVRGQMRTWVDRSGKHRVEAELVRVQNNQVTLRNAAGKEVTLPINRLSADDQAYLKQQAAGSAGADAQSGGNPAQAKPVAKRFFTALIDQDFEVLKSLLTAEGQANWDAAESLLEDLDVPDNRQSVLVRTAKREGDHVDVNVSIKVRGKYLRQRLQLRWSGKEWLVASLIPDKSADQEDGDDEEEEKEAEPIDFEHGSGSSSSDDDDFDRDEEDR